MPGGPAKFDVNRCNESPLRGEKSDFWPVSKFNTGSLPLRGILPVTIYAGIYILYSIYLYRYIHTELQFILVLSTRNLSCRDH